MADTYATTAKGQELQRRLGALRWQEVVRDAERRAAIYAAVEAALAQGVPRRQAIRDHGEGTHRATFAHWRQAVEAGDGPLWERLLDRRVAPESPPLPAAMR